MKRIFKYTVNIANGSILQMYNGSKIVHVADVSKFMEVTFWAEVDTSLRMVNRTFAVFGTGHEIPNIDRQHLEYVGTAVSQQGALIWHLYEKIDD